MHEDPAEVVPLRDRGAAAEDPPPLGVAFFVLITLFPFYYIIVLSMREISEVVESPGSIFIGLGDSPSPPSPPRAWTVSLGVSQRTNIETPATTLMAGSVILTIPIIVLFLFAERLMTEGLTRGAEMR